MIEWHPLIVFNAVHLCGIYDLMIAKNSQSVSYQSFLHLNPCENGIRIKFCTSAPGGKHFMPGANRLIFLIFPFLLYRYRRMMT